jgi:ABC-type branched-subunit amino acid transport system ATPase component
LAEHLRPKAVLSVERLTAGYSKVPIINDISLDVGASEVVVVIGPNGCGKSTLLKAMMGLIRVESGTVSLQKASIDDLATFERARAGLGYVPQNYSIFSSLTVVENLETAAISLRREQRAKRLDMTLGVFPDLARARKKRAGALSGGQRNLLGVARAMMLEPKALLVDEPTAGLSPTNATAVWQQLIAVARAGTSVLVVEQSVSSALEHADWSFVLVNGRNRMDASAQDIAKVDLGSVFLGASQ